MFSRSVDVPSKLVLAVLAGLASGGSVLAADEVGQLPQPVAKAVSDLVYACRAAGQALVQPSTYVNAADIDGDRRLDFVVDPSKGCEANRTARCTSDGCSIDVYLSSRLSDGAVGLRGSQTSIEIASGQASLRLVRATPECQGTAAPADCQEILRFSKGALGKVAQ